jgi:hypothetical protein
VQGWHLPSPHLCQQSAAAAAAVVLLLLLLPRQLRQQHLHLPLLLQAWLLLAAHLLACRHPLLLLHRPQSCREASGWLLPESLLCRLSHLQQLPLLLLLLLLLLRVLPALPLLLWPPAASPA